MSEAEAPEEEEEDDDEVYEFVAAGENTCERCAALAGSQWLEPPNPPHAHCECEVQIKGFGRRAEQRQCGDNVWSAEGLPNGTVRYGPGGLSGMEWGFNVTVDCWDGSFYTFELWVDMGDDTAWPNTDDVFDDMEAYAWSEMYDEAEAVAAQMCRDCTDPLVS